MVIVEKFANFSFVFLLLIFINISATTIFPIYFLENQQFFAENLCQNQEKPITVC